jgi:PAS domain S-box-containing protein
MSNMKDHKKTKAQLLDELAELHQEVTRLKAIETRYLELQERINESGLIGEAFGEGDSFLSNAIISRAEEVFYLTQLSIDSAPDPIFWIGPDARLLYVNQGACHMLGYSRKELLSMTVHDIDPDFTPEIWPQHWEELKKKRSTVIESRHRAKDGRVIPVEISINYLEFNGQAYNFVFARDMTKHKQAEEALRVSEERFALAVQGTNDGLWDWDIANNMVYWSPRLKEMHGYADDELDVDLDTFSSLLHPDDKEQMKAAMKAHLKDRVPLSLENRIRTKSGEYRWHYVRGQAVWDETGRALRLVGSVTDITERKRTEEALRQSEDLFAKAFHTGPTPMAISRVSDAMLIDVNQRWEDQWGYRREGVIGRTALELNLYVDPNDPVRLRQLIREHGFVRDYELKVRLESGELRDMLMSLENVEIYDGPCFLATFYDITEEKQAKESLTKRVTELETVAQVSTAALNILDTTELLQTVVDLTKDRFDLYHAHIYLLDEITDALVLVAGAGEVGPQMVAEGWKIPFEQEQSLVARAARTRQGVIVNDVSEVPNWLPNPLLPNTRSEMAVPLLVGERVLGVLDVQSDEVGRFTGDDIRIQTTLAAQVAVALENARLFEEGQRSSFLLNERVKELDCLNDIGREMEESPPPLPELLQWITERIPPALQYPDLSVVAIEFDGQVYGVSEAVELPNQIVHGLYIGGELMGRIYIAHTEKRDFIDEESVLLGGAATRLSSFIENQHLLKQTQQRSVELERVLAEVRQLAAIVETHPDFIGIGTLDGKILYVNPAGLRMMGLPPDHVVMSMEISDFHATAEVEKLLKEGIPAAIEKGSWSTDEANLRKTDGATIPVEETVSINYDVEGKPSTFCVTMHDITNRKVAAAEQERLLAEVEVAYRQYVRQEWERYLQEQHQDRWHIEHQQTGVEIEPDTEGLAKVQEEVFREGKTKIVSGTDENGDSQPASEGHNETAAIVTPISLRGQVIGTLNLQDVAPDRNWTAEEVALVEAVSEQLALTIENLRLFDDTQRHATREQLTRQITDKMRAAPDVDSIIQTGLTEIAKALGVSRTYVKLSPSLKSDQQEP